MKVLLPVGILVAIIVSVAWPYISSLSKVESEPLNVSHPAIKENRMLNPQYMSVDDKGRPYSVTADWAKQRTDTLADLIKPQGSFAFEEGKSLQVKAQRGIYDAQKKNMELTKDVVLTSSDGYSVRTEKATISLETNVVDSTTYVEGEGPKGSIRGQDGCTIETIPEGKIITLKGRSRVIIDSKNEPIVNEKNIKPHAQQTPPIS